MSYVREEEAFTQTGRKQRWRGRHVGRGRALRLRYSSASGTAWRRGSRTCPPPSHNLPFTNRNHNLPFTHTHTHTHTHKHTHTHTHTHQSPVDWSTGLRPSRHHTVLVAIAESNWVACGVCAFTAIEASPFAWGREFDTFSTK